MSRPDRRPGLATAALLLGLLLGAGCQRQDLSNSTFVTMADNTFSPSEMRIPVGGHIHFRNLGGTVHNAIAIDGSWDTKGVTGETMVQTGEWVDIKFDRAGVYHYYCKFHGTPDGKMGMVGTVIVGDVAVDSSDRKGGRMVAVGEPTGVIRHVPSEYATIQAGVDAASPGDLVLIGAGVYREEVIVTTPSVTIRGVDRNGVVLEGEFQRSNGITVFADAVAVENLTARNYTLNGFFFTGVTGYRGSYISAINNGDYGIYAFDSSNGVLDHSLGSGSPDAGFYVGGCYPCKTILDSVAGSNNVGGGYSGTNSGGDLYIVNSVFENNEGGGVAPNTFDVEPHAPQRETIIVGNLIVGNRGSGVSVVGGNRNVIERNYIADNTGNGISIFATRDRNYYPSTDNVVRDNLIANSGKVDLALGGPGNLGNCFEGNLATTTLPWGLQLLQRCRGVRLPVVGDPGAYLASVAGRNAFFRPGRVFTTEWKTWPVPRPEPSMPNAISAPVRPALHPFEDHPVLLDRIVRPDPAPVLAAKAGGR